ncbi:MAG TPA: cyclic nucleotide-binding domain-containing protein, partial [Enhygromyxa sp.]|nr:cyclic nucleotide-binding domain-containing protein [Enhygromyxa sp.]
MLSLATRLDTVSQATSVEQREAIDQFRYAVMVEERGRVGIPGADHQRRRCHTPGDDEPGTLHVFTGSAAELDTAARLRRWAPGELPDDIRETYSLDLVPQIDDLAIAEISQIVARPIAPARARLSILSLFKACFEACLEPCSEQKQGADLLVFDAHPGLVRHLARLLGARRYGGDLTRRSGGLQVPMVIVVSDCSHFERAGSLFAPLAWKAFVLGRRPKIDVGTFAVRFVDDLTHGVDVEQTWPAMEERFFRRGVDRWSFFAGLRSAIVDELMARGTVREVDEGEVILHEDDEIEEMYVVLEGCFEIFANGKSVDVAGKGEIVGEIALFSPETRRTAIVEALIPSRVLALTPAALRNLALGDSDSGYQVMFNLARFM